MLCGIYSSSTLGLQRVEAHGAEADDGADGTDGGLARVLWANLAQCHLARRAWWEGQTATAQ